jgi:hypothetical protein
MHSDTTQARSNGTPWAVRLGTVATAVLLIASV